MASRGRKKFEHLKGGGYGGGYGKDGNKPKSLGKMPKSAKDSSKREKDVSC